jgi:DNA repair exonuclease SbcCD ATPase subunit
MVGFAFIVAVVAVVLAVVFFFQGQSAAGAVKGLGEEADAARKETEAARAELRRTQEEMKVRSSQLTETREKLAEARRKGQDARGGKTQPRGAREAELEEDLAHARKLTEDAHAAEVHARREIQAAKAAEAQLRSEIEKVQARNRELQERPGPVAQVAPPPAPAPELQSTREQLEAAKSELERQVAAADKHARDARRREQELREELRKHKGRAETNNRVYLVTKGELELVRERLAQAERRLWQAGIPLAPPAQKDRPKATGPAAAERGHEEHAEAAPAEHPASPLEAASPEAAAAGEPIGAEEAEGGGTPVPPIRRRAENGVEKKPD